MAEKNSQDTRDVGGGLASNPSSFFKVNYNQMDSGLSHEQKKEWDAIYASYRSRAPLNGMVVGVDTHSVGGKTVYCLVLMDFRVKVLIPQSELWFSENTEIPDFVIKKMVGARIDYVITSVDRVGECATASRRLALSYRRNGFFKDQQRNVPGALLDCTILTVGPTKLIIECNGFDFQLRNRDLTYTAIADLRTDYRPGQRLQARLMKTDPEKEVISISLKDVNPNPFDGADKRHPVGCTRKAVISGSYAGGVFCRLNDDVTCLCLYSPNYFTDELYTNDTVLIAITEYNYDKKQIFGKIVSKI